LGDVRGLLMDKSNAVPDVSSNANGISHHPIMSRDKGSSRNGDRPEPLAQRSRVGRTVDD
jgi:hypothetical protein